MKLTQSRFLSALFVAAVMQATSAVGQTLDFIADGQAADLQCPTVTAPARRPAAAGARQAGGGAALEPPTREEVAEFLATEAPSGENSGLQLKSGVRGRPVRIAFWGDSHLAAHFFGEELVRLSGLRKQAVQPQFLPATMGRAGVRLPLRKRCQGGDWRYRHAYADSSHEGRFGPALAQLHGQTPGSYLWVDFRRDVGEPALRGLEMQFELPPPDAPMPVLGVQVDDGEERILVMDRAFDGVVKINASQAMSVLRLRLIHGDAVLEGFRPRYLEAAALYLDTLAIPGATIQGWARIDPATMKARLGAVDYDVVALQYGTNEGNRRPFDAEAYSADLRLALAHLRQVFPVAQCVLIGPTDRGVLVPRTRAAPRHPAHSTSELLRFAEIHRQISDIQRRVARQHHCVFWNWQAEMGGPGAAYRWLYRNPPFMARDLIHLTIPGYQQSARDFASDLGFVDWLRALP